LCAKRYVFAWLWVLDGGRDHETGLDEDLAHGHALRSGKDDGRQRKDAFARPVPPPNDERRVPRRPDVCGAPIAGGVKCQAGASNAAKLCIDAVSSPGH
jgi:hypothetical protein